MHSAVSRSDNKHAQALPSFRCLWWLPRHFLARHHLHLMKVLQSLSSQTLVSIPLLVPSFVVPLLQHRRAAQTSTASTGKLRPIITTTTTTVLFSVHEMATLDSRKFSNVTSDDVEEGAPEFQFPTDREVYERPSPPPVPHKHGIRINASVVESDKLVQEMAANHPSVARELTPHDAFPGRTGLQKRGTSPTAWVLESGSISKVSVAPFPSFP
ncbi:hypothetical protein BGW80DRAFT_1567880 [Lactifluus volemus]|nr:hypothetical protein BGW80DRAFT_1567880 [Lactifluus volemus]